ncbi:hypothetical protein I3760_01G273000 [Carya illinoinensis]|nr:hypothetical protein I3760_01G273000 [Carya illinoinensis]
MPLFLPISKIGWNPFLHIICEPWASESKSKARAMTRTALLLFRAQSAQLISSRNYFTSVQKAHLGVLLC